MFRRRAMDVGCLVAVAVALLLQGGSAFVSPLSGRAAVSSRSSASLYQARVQTATSPSSLTTESMSTATATAAAGGQRRGELVMKPGDNISLFGKIVGGTAVAIYLGSSFIPRNFFSRNSNSMPTSVRVKQADGSVKVKGAMMGMSRFEVETKLSQIPCFFARTPSGGVLTDGGVGKFYMEAGDAETAIKAMRDAKVPGAQDVELASTTFDDVFYPLILKQKRLVYKNSPEARMPANVYGAGVARNCDKSLTYKIVPSAAQVAKATELTRLTEDTWNAGEDDSAVPLFLADKLAFAGVGSSVKIPMFLDQDDMFTSWQKLESEDESPTILVTTVARTVRMMEKGGGRNRLYEFYPTKEIIDDANKFFPQQQAAPPAAAGDAAAAGQ